MRPRPWLIIVLGLLAGLSVWLWQLPGDGDPWPPGQPHPRSSGARTVHGVSIQFPPLAESPRLAESSGRLAERLAGASWADALALLGEPDERLGGTDPPVAACWWSVARYDGDTGDTGWHEPIVHLQVAVRDDRIASCHWIGGEARELGVAAPTSPPPAIPAGMGPPRD